MECREFKKISGGYLEDVVPPEKKHEAEAHLATCPVCAALIKQMTVMRERLRVAFCKDCCPDNLRQRITRQLPFAAFSLWIKKIFSSYRS